MSDTADDQHQTYDDNAWTRVRGAIAGLAQTAHPDVVPTSTVRDADTLAFWAASYRRVVGTGDEQHHLVTEDIVNYERLTHTLQQLAHDGADEALRAQYAHRYEITKESRKLLRWLGQTARSYASRKASSEDEDRDLEYGLALAKYLVEYGWTPPAPEFTTEISED
ncbi:hypothetical protein SEA_SMOKINGBUNNY_70 [Gordonia phage SmokingBunny]|uniref:Uncharacterized protein n=2 Tax=Wizardvirus TaxID=2169658 RepID=A0A515MHK5_9CAUD|nr:hypothetical protein KNU53_gp70 [Gordonia phage SmokingBunny]YP_010103083.1 hypothetical protein KNU63_gp73 [Gordonia phage RogerDodger]QCG77881.1 hypothetical protein SEA_SMOKINGBUNNY_70 [Gordonia phage SmokingBunny]QDM56155.1 hypothetical protein SEA_ROGERDODGER_73 [Gordonia phage RogerDodger]WAA20287.1 hypothetical protein SEA_TOGO_69 [Gordonia phage Togo]